MTWVAQVGSAETLYQPCIDDDESSQPLRSIVAKLCQSLLRKVVSFIWDVIGELAVVVQDFWYRMQYIDQMGALAMIVVNRGWQHHQGMVRTLLRRLVLLIQGG